MADITGNQTDSQALRPSPLAADDSLTERLRPSKLRPSQVRLIGAGALLALLIVCLAVWGSGMEFPTTVSTSEVQTSEGVTPSLLPRRCETLPGTAIDDAVRWLQSRGFLAFWRIEFRSGLCPAQD